MLDPILSAYKRRKKRIFNAVGDRDGPYRSEGDESAAESLRMTSFITPPRPMFFDADVSVIDHKFESRPYWEPAEVRFSSDGIVIRTAPQAWAYAAIAELPFQKARDDEFCWLRIVGKVFRGEVRAALLQDDQFLNEQCVGLTITESFIPIPRDWSGTKLTIILRNGQFAEVSIFACERVELIRESLENFVVQASPRAGNIASRLYLIYQGGKVTSQTLEASIRAADPGAEVERHHYLSEKMLNEFDRIYSREARSSDELSSARYQVIVANTARHRLFCGDEIVWVLTGIRDPLDLAISAFFQNLSSFCSALTYDAAALAAETCEVKGVFEAEFKKFRQRSGAKLRSDTFLELHIDSKLKHLGEWFEDEFSDVFGLDVYQFHIGSRPFIEFEMGRFRFFLYRFESLRQSLLERLPIQGEAKILNRNVGSEKLSGALYCRFRDGFAPSEEMFHYYYGGRYFSHFYQEFSPAYPRVAC